MRKILTIVLAISIGLNAGLLVRALRTPSGPSEDGPRQQEQLDEILTRHFERMTADLDLSAAQQAEIRKAHDASLPSIRKAQARLESARSAVRNSILTAVDAPDEFRGNVLELQQSRARLDSLLTEMFIVEMTALDPVQRERYVEVSPWNRPFVRSPPQDDGNERTRSGSKGNEDR